MNDISLEKLKLMCVFAHPDDETLGTGGILARYADEGIETYLVTATRGERGWFDDPEKYPGPETLAEVRQSELHAAAQVLGIQEVNLLGYRDGELNQADPREVIAKLVRAMRRVRPDVVVTFGPYGIYGHPDHIAISQWTAAAVVAAADPAYLDAGSLQSHCTAKLYYLVGTRDSLAAYQVAFGDLVMEIDGRERRATGWETWAITTSVDTSAYWQKIWEAVECHRSQLPGYQALKELPEEHKRSLWDAQHFYRVFSLVDGAGQEDDLFTGLRS